MSEYNKKIDGYENISMDNILLSNEELQNHCMNIAKKHIVSEKYTSCKSLLPRLNNNYNVISKLYKHLNEIDEERVNLSGASNWLLDNFYKLEEEVKFVRQEVDKDRFLELNILANGIFEGFPRVYDILFELVSHTDAKLDENVIIEFIKSYQKHSILSMAEIWSLSIVIRCCLIEKIRNICELIYKDQLKYENIKSLNINNEELMNFIRKEINKENKIDFFYIEYLMKKMRSEDYDLGKIKSFIEQNLSEYNITLDEIIDIQHKEQAYRQMAMGNSIMSLNQVSKLNWISVFESLSVVEKILKNDPCSIYIKMDFESRDYYRRKIEKISKKYNISEFEISQKAIELSNKIDDKDNKLNHVGYYIVGNGITELLGCFGYKDISNKNTKYPYVIYFLPIIMITWILTLLMTMYSYKMSSNIYISLLAFIFSYIPSSTIGISLVNWVVTHNVEPDYLPKLEYSNGIGEDASTMVVIPTLITNEKAVDELIDKLEVYYNSNKEDNIYFCIAGDFKDSKQETTDKDEIIVEKAFKKIRKLNEKYKKGDIFFYFHRHRTYSKQENKWMGWERKRGALVELNELLKGSNNTSYSMISSDISHIQNKIKYVITIDADTNLVMDSAKKLIGTITHPLNKAILSKDRNLVVDGYGIIQPRIGLDIESTGKSMFTKIFAGQGGIDSYTTAISDVYQDLFFEGIFTGKGIYDLNVFDEVLKKSIPENSILSHDLLEGCYIRTGLATDIELIDSYPSNYSSFSMRLHRWIRGDWQLIKWLFSKNPLSTLSKWKIKDNLRRSLDCVSTLILIILGLTILPGYWWCWVGFSVFAFILPIILEFINCIVCKYYKNITTKTNSDLIYGCRELLYQALILFAFLPYQSYLMLDAISRTLYRVFVSKSNLLEWTTAADAEKKIKNDMNSYLKRMQVCIYVSVITFGLVYILNPTNIIYAFLICLLWFISPFIAYKISEQIDRNTKIDIDKEDRILIRKIARKTWLYYEKFAGKDQNYLPADNFQENPYNGVAKRTSPTNIGFLLISIMSARDLGYISTTTMLNKITNTLETINKLEKYEGHLFNWYDNKNLNVLLPRYISTVDSGNFVGYLITLKQGLLEYISKPIVDRSILEGIRDSIMVCDCEYEDIDSIIQKESLCINDFEKLFVELLLNEQIYNNTDLNIRDFIKSIINDINSFLLNDHHKRYLNTIEGLNKLVEKVNINTNILTLRQIYKDILKKIDDMKIQNEDSISLNVVISDLINNIDEFEETIIDLTKTIDDIVDNTDFTKLYDVEKDLFSIGYDIDSNKLTNSYYDLLASEARLTSYIAVAKKQIPQKHWFKLGRSLSIVDGYRGLVSWTGTMFEYFMPPLIMKNYTNSLLDETYNTVIRAQKKYGTKRDVPWGTSESGYYKFDMDLNYQYKAFGVPDLGLKRGLSKDMVISPYSTVLALLFDQNDCITNIKKLINMGMEGKYGLYEAIDFTNDRVALDKDSSIVESFMAHHQGMSFVTINNYLNFNIMQKRFHSDPAVKGAEILLQEKIPVRSIITKEYKEEIKPLEKDKNIAPKVTREYDDINYGIPRCHILSNGKYLSMVTDCGCGYIKKNRLQISRWREDLVTGNYGLYIFVKNLNNNDIFSTTYKPIDTKPDYYKVRFHQDKAEFIRKDNYITTNTQVIVSTEDDAEIRKVTITNNSNESAIIELTSYLETVLIDQAADIAHPAFTNLFIRTKPVLEYESIICSRRPRSEGEQKVWMSHTISTNANSIGNLEYETNRGNFIGRGNNIKNPKALNQPLTNTCGAVLDPIMSLRKKVNIDVGCSVDVFFTTSIADNMEDILSLSKKYHDISCMDRIFELSDIRSQVESSYLNFDEEEVTTYQDMISHILYLSPSKRRYQDIIKNNIKAQHSLWGYGISGDIPIVLVSIKNEEEIDIVKQVLNAHEYFRMKGLVVDILILNEDESNYLQPLQDLIIETVRSKYGYDLIDKHGGIFIRNANTIPREDQVLFYSAARIVLKSGCESIKSQLDYEDYDYDIEQKVFNEDDKEYESSDEQLDLDYFNGYGGFSKDKKEYVIRITEETSTPLPWINVISNKKFGFQVSENGSGYTWSENSRENKLTLWSNDPVIDPSSEVIYIRDDYSGRIWTTTPLPIREKESYTVHHGHGYSKFIHDSNGIQQELVMFVPTDKSIKISMIKLKNKSDSKRKLTLTNYIRPVMGVSDQTMQKYVITDINDDIMIIKNPYNPDYSPKISYMACSEKVSSYTGDRLEFLGFNGELKSPASLKREGLSNNIGAGFDPCACIQTCIELDIGEEKDIVFLLGQDVEIQNIHHMVNEYTNVDRAKNALDKSIKMWDDILGKIQVKTPDKSMDLMLNNWLSYQNICCRIWARSAFYQSGGAYGFRDQLQDSMNALNLIPNQTREQILLHCAHQFVEGDVQHWWHPGPEADKGIRTKFSDDLLWLPYATIEYIKNTGDYSILKEEVHFLEEEELKEEDERYGTPRVSKEKGSVYNHCIRSIERSLKFGEHGIPLMGSGDWNDGMSTVGNKGKGESVWLGWFLYTILGGFSKICEKMNDLDNQKKYNDYAKKILSSIEENAWDGKWYKRAYFDDGTPLGSIQNSECIIDSLAQSWAVISDGGDKGRREEAMESLNKYLVKEDDGMILLFTPPFDEGNINPGYIKGYVPGVRENGGQYTHAATWVIKAYAMMGKGDKAWKLYNSINPINHTRTGKECSKYKVEPYVMAADVYSTDSHIGRGGWTWYTGTAGWMYKVGIEDILGLKKYGDEIVIDPCIPNDWKQYSIEYKYGESKYSILIKNPHKVNNNVKYITVNGNKKNSNKIKLIDDKKEHNIEVILG
ncbi:GH36-type glycosyl hydrolase domain-containing protein [Tepidibacter hydrothermalis]|uniref:Glucoamylase family protein n=1 Tax=Tepidibacter hydrothermalis TaxID=3036126 RepID=A0ABY8EFD4_9FIRM|nr:glucoamylase family protein [Tepidibacter hydrothermalis]WFD11662.1 glucoamylase family protein [Tepidibacter hydrothermalis]